MTSATTPQAAKIEYSESTMKRAERALACSRFKLPLLMAMRTGSVPLSAIASQKGYQNNYTEKPAPELVIENDLMWFIQVGLLRREVDGQGITDTFRLTPLGHQITRKWEQQGEQLPKPSVWERLANFARRWLRLRF
jgi:hypothetical protein